MDLNDEQLRGSLGAKFEAFEREMPPLIIGRIQADLARIQAEKRAVVMKRALWSLSVLVVLFGSYWLIGGTKWSLSGGKTEPVHQLSEGGANAPVSGIDYSKEPLTDGAVNLSEAEPTYKPEVTAQLNQDQPAEATNQLSAPRSGEATVPEAPSVKTPEIKTSATKTPTIALATKPEAKEPRKAAVEPAPAKTATKPVKSAEPSISVITKAESTPSKRVEEASEPVVATVVKRKRPVAVASSESVISKAEQTPSKRVEEAPEPVAAPVVRRRKPARVNDNATADVIALVETAPKRTRKAMPEPVLEAKPEVVQTKAVEPVIKPEASKPVAEAPAVAPVEKQLTRPAVKSEPKPAPDNAVQPAGQPDRASLLAKRSMNAPRTGRLKGNSDIAKQVLAAQNQVQEQSSEATKQELTSNNATELQQVEKPLAGMLMADSAGYVKPIVAQQAQPVAKPVDQPAAPTQQLDKPSADVLSKSGSRTSYAVRGAVYNTRYTVLANPTGEQEVIGMQSSTGLVSRLAADLMAVHQYQLTNSLQLQTGLGLLYAQNSNEIRFTEGEVTGYSVNNGSYAANLLENQLALTQRRLMAQLSVNLAFKPLGKTSNFYLTGGLQGYLRLMRQELVTLNGLAADATMVETRFGKSSEPAFQAGFSLGIGYRFLLPANMTLDLEPTYKSLFTPQQFGNRFIMTTPEWFGIGAKVTF